MVVACGFTDWEEEFSLRAEGAGVLRGSGAMGVDEFDKRARKKGQINNPKSRCESRGNRTLSGIVPSLQNRTLELWI